MNFDYAIAREFHRKTPFEVADEIKRLIAEQPKVSFEQLEAGQVVYYKSSYGDRDQVLRVVKTTPETKAGRCRAGRRSLHLPSSDGKLSRVVLSAQ